MIKSNKRAAAFQRILICFSQIYECQSPSAADGIPRFQIGIKKLEKFCAAEETLDTETKSHLRFVFDLFQEVAEEYPETFGDNHYVKVKTFAPIEFVAVSVLLSQKGANRPKGLLRGDILTLRLQLRSEHVDLRMNQSVWASAWRFIDDLERHRGTVDGSTVRKATKKPSQTSKREVKHVAQPSNGTTSSNAARLKAKKNDQSVSTDKGVSDGHRPESVQHQLAQAADSAIGTQLPAKHIHHSMGPTSSARSPKVIVPTKQADITGASPAINGDSQVLVAPMTIDQVRKRSNGFLGRSSGGAEALAAKKARLAGQGVKQED